MSGGNTGSQDELHAPTYNELFNAVSELREKLRLLETAMITQSPPTNPNPIPNAMPTVDYRILPDVGTYISTIF